MKFLIYNEYFSPEYAVIERKFDKSVWNAVDDEGFV